MTKLTFTEWVEHWGEPRLVENIASSQKANERRWEKSKDHRSLHSSPAWELRLGSYWQESLIEWNSRWQSCGGRLRDGRMIAPKWDGIWKRLSNTFPDGLGRPYPPYARSSCAYWADIDQDEAIVSGAISESEFQDYMAQFPFEPLKDKEGNLIPIELLQAALTELEENIYHNGGPRPGATRAERVAHKHKQLEESFAQAQAEYEQRKLERSEKNAVFRLLEQVEESLGESSSAHDPHRWEWLCTSVSTLTTTAYFDNYPYWRARAWLACADLNRLKLDPANELLCLEHALSINSKLAIKRRIKKLQTQAEEE